MKIISIFLCFVLLLSVVSATGIPEEEADFRVAQEEKEELLAALYESDIPSARRALDLGLITCVELTQYFLERIEAYNHTYNCFITLCDNAIEEAKARDKILRQKGEHSMLLGIPIVVKDNIAYKGYPTTNGYWKYGSVSWESATVVQKLLDAGAVVLGKSNMATAAEEAQFTASDAVGETLNAYGVELSAGGSSGGSASAVSLNFCYGGLGTDTNASLRYPAVLNGCVTLRPTKDLLDRQGVIILNYTRDVPGVITRSIEDQAILLGEMAGKEYYSALNGNALEGKRIGILAEFSYNETCYAYRRESKVDTEIKDAFFEAVDNLRALGAKVFTVSVPNIYSLAENCENNASYAIERYLAVYEQLFAHMDLDAVIFPTYLHTPDNSLKNKGWSNVTYDAFYSNCSLLSSPLGVPEIAIPIGYHSKGSGIGLEIAALKGQEQLLLDIAYTYTETYDTRAVPENSPGLYDTGRPLSQILEEEEAKQEALRLKAEAEKEQNSTETETSPGDNKENPDFSESSDSHGNTQSSQSNIGDSHEQDPANASDSTHDSTDSDAEDHEGSQDASLYGYKRKNRFLLPGILAFLALLGAGAWVGYQKGITVDSLISRVKKILVPSPSEKEKKVYTSPSVPRKKHKKKSKKKRSKTHSKRRKVTK